MGIKHKVKRLAAKAAGAPLLQEQVDTLFYFLNKYLDIESVPPADGDLRRLQLCGAEMLGIFDDLCKKHGLMYWLDYGTLLGAARHRGYIPWDDDLDVSMLRDDWNRAAEVLPLILEPLGFYVRVYSESWFGFGYQRDETGLWMDVFCYETATVCDDAASRERLESEIEKQLAYCRRKKTFNVEPLIDRAAMKAHRLETLYSEQRATRAEETVLFLSPEIESALSNCVFAINSFFPLSHLSFEGSQYPVPANWNDVLRAFYGSYMEFPRGGILHHGLEGVSLAEIAASKNVDLNTTLAELNAIKVRMGE